MKPWSPFGGGRNNTKNASCKNVGFFDTLECGVDLGWERRCDGRDWTVAVKPRGRGWQADDDDAADTRLSNDGCCNANDDNAT